MYYGQRTSIPTIGFGTKVPLNYNQPAKTPNVVIDWRGQRRGVDPRTQAERLRWLLRAYGKWKSGQGLTTRERHGLRDAWQWIQQRRAAAAAQQTGQVPQAEAPPPSDAEMAAMGLSDMPEDAMDAATADAAGAEVAAEGPNWLIIGGIAAALAAGAWYLWGGKKT